MTLKHMYLALLAAATVAGFLLRLLDAGVAGISSGRGLGVTTGGVTALFLVAALVPTLMVLFSRKPIASVASPTAIGTIVLTAFAYLAYRGIEVERTLASVIFEPPGCTFSASFPGQPELKKQVLMGGLVMTQANFYGRDTFLRAECLPTEARFLPTTEGVIAELRKYADGDGLTDIEFEVVELDGFVRGLARGRKTVSGNAATYEVHLLTDGASIMSLAAGGLSSGYPQPGIQEFLSSGKHIYRSNSTQDAFESRTDTSIEIETTSHSSSFVTLNLPFDVAIDIPRDWWTLNDAANLLIRTSRDAALDLRGIPTSEDDETVLIAANSWPPVTYAALRVTRVLPPLATPEEVAGLSGGELAQLKGEFETEMRQLLPLQGLTFLETTEIEIEEIGGWPAIVFSYRRSGPRGPVFVELIQIVRRQDSLRINLSYREDERALWMPVILRTKNSFRAGQG